MDFLLGGSAAQHSLNAMAHSSRPPANGRRMYASGIDFINHAATAGLVLGVAAIAAIIADNFAKPIPA